MTIDFTGQTVLVTGAAGGIGRAYSRLLAARGANVIVNDLAVDGQSSEAARSLVDELVAAGGSAVADVNDVATAQGGEAMVAAAIERFGALHAVIHNAGILADRSLAKMTSDDIDRVMAVHLLGAFHVVLPAFRAMREARYGRILLTTSGSGLAGMFGQANYGAAKAGVVGLMHVAAIEGAERGILVNAIAPGARTSMTKGLLGDLEDRLDPEYVAPMAAYLVSSACTSTHEIYSAAGGRFARYFVGTTPGWFDPSAAPSSIEDIAAHIDDIRATDDYRILDRGSDEGDMLRAAFAR